MPSDLRLLMTKQAQSAGRLPRPNSARVHLDELGSIAGSAVRDIQAAPAVKPLYSTARGAEQAGRSVNVVAVANLARQLARNDSRYRGRVAPGNFTNAADAQHFLDRNKVFGARARELAYREFPAATDSLLAQANEARRLARHIPGLKVLDGSFHDRKSAQRFIDRNPLLADRALRNIGVVAPPKPAGLNR